MNNGQVMSQDKGIEKFRNININIKVTTPILFKNYVSIKRFYLHQFLESNDKIQILSGGGFEHGNGKEYGEMVEIYLKDISEDELKSMLKELNYKVSWHNLWGN